MKKLKFYRRALLIVSSIALLAAGCSKEKFGSPKVNPTPQSGAIKGYVLPAKAKAIVSLYRHSDKILAPAGDNDLVARVAADNDGSFAMENIPAGNYTLAVFPTNKVYGNVQFDVAVTDGNTTELNISLPNKEE